MTVMMYWYFIRCTLAPEARCLNNKNRGNNRIGGHPAYIGGDLLHAKETQASINYHNFGRCSRPRLRLAKV